MLHARSLSMGAAMANWSSWAGRIRATPFQFDVGAAAENTYPEIEVTKSYAESCHCGAVRFEALSGRQYIKDVQESAADL